MWRIVHLERTRFAKRYGRRGMLLALSGLAWIGIGWSTARDPVDRFSGPGHDGTLLDALDGAWMGYLWAVCGLVAVVTAVLRDRRITSNHDAVGFNAILTPPLVWTFGFAWSAVMYWLTGGEDGRSSSAIAIIVYALVCLFIMTVAGWSEGPTEPVQQISPTPPPRDSTEVA